MVADENLLTGQLTSEKKWRHKRASCVWGYHIYQHIWFAAIGEVFSCERDSTNLRDRYAVAVKKICSNNRAFTSKGITCLFTVCSLYVCFAVYINEVNLEYSHVLI